jgi:DNA-binding transcriptional MerR regulator
MDKKSFHSITDVSRELNLPNYVLRFWEEKFPKIAPLKNKGRRYYRVEDIELLKLIKDLLYNKGYTIKGAQKYLESKGSVEEQPTQLFMQNNNIYKVQLLLEKLYALKTLINIENEK